MGGMNSGRSSRFVSSERTASIIFDITKLLRHTKPHECTATWTMWRYGEEGSMGWLAARFKEHGAGLGVVELCYDINHWSRPTEQRCQQIDCESRPCRFGGQRWYLRCPRTDRLCVKLFLPNGRVTFASRAGYRLAYQVERESPLDRAHRRLGRLYRKLGQHYRGPICQVPTKPKWMRWKTFDELERSIEHASEQLHTAWLEGATRIISRAA